VNAPDRIWGSRRLINIKVGRSAVTHRRWPFTTCVTREAFQCGAAEAEDGSGLGFAVGFDYIES
jgi:hypothetical protein